MNLDFKLKPHGYSYYVYELAKPTISFDFMLIADAT